MQRTSADQQDSVIWLVLGIDRGGPVDLAESRLVDASTLPSSDYSLARLGIPQETP